MNRRGFIGKALAGLAAVPLLGRLVQAKSDGWIYYDVKQSRTFTTEIHNAVEWHPSMIPGCVYWDGVSYRPDGAKVHYCILEPHGGAFNRVLSQNERNQVRSYLNKKYGP